MKSFAALKSRGFALLTVWELRNTSIKPRCTCWDTTSGWLYAFVTNVRVRYIGMSTTVLRSRLDGYSYQANDRVGRLIRDQLAREVPVEIYGTKRNQLTRKRLEQEERLLINEFRPDWNAQHLL